MSRREDDEERERPSWREIDQRRDRPRERAPARERLPKKQAEWVRKMALRQAEALFQGKRGRPEYQQAVKELEAARGSRKFVTVAKKFLEEYGLPEEWGLLNLFLDFPDAEVAVQALTAMAEQWPRRSYVERQGFKSRLKILQLTSPQARVRARAEELLASLG